MKDSLYFYDPNHGGCLRIMNKIDVMDATFVTTSPSALDFLPQNNKNF